MVILILLQAECCMRYERVQTFQSLNLEEAISFLPFLWFDIFSSVYFEIHNVIKHK